MPNTLVVGGQWGDEAKGKIVHRLAKDHKIVVRYNGGNNAGHTLDNITLHLMPSGILYDHTINLMAQGMVVNPEALYQEWEDVRKVTGKQVESEHLIISPNAQLILPHHIALDQAGSKKSIGTTGRGIGPAYSQKADRVGIRAGDILDESLRATVEKSVGAANVRLEKLGTETVKIEDVMKFLEDYGKNFLSQFVGDVKTVLKEAKNKDVPILFEGAQGTLLDIDAGTYPYVTSSNTLRPSAGQLGLYVPIDNAYGVFKTPMSRVGKGPFPTEWGGPNTSDTRQLIEGDTEAMKGDNRKFMEELFTKIKNGTATPLEIGAYYGHKGKEYGATTGRARRLGPLDIVLMRYAIDVNGLNGVILTKMDVYSGAPKVELCDAYIDDSGNKVADLSDLNDLQRMKPRIQELSGWDANILGVTEIDSLPAQARKYIDNVEHLAGVPVVYVSTGQKSEHLIVR